MEGLRRDQAEAPTKTAKRTIFVIGNSVARWLKFLTARMVSQVLARRFPNVAFHVANMGKHSNTDEFTPGGHGPEHLLFCGDLSKLAKADLVLIHFTELARIAPLVEMLHRLPTSPLLVVIKHCTSPQLEIGLVGEERASARESAWLARVKQRDIWSVEERRSRVAHYARSERADAEVVARFNLTSVDSCALLRGILRDDCRLGGSGMARMGPYQGDLPRFLREMYFTPAKTNISKGLADPVHQSPVYSVLQGCVTAALMVSMPRATGAAAAALPAPAMVAAPSGWCITTRSGARPGVLPLGLRARGLRDGALEVLQSLGWEAKQGGVDGSKRWLEAHQVGSQLTLRIGDVLGMRRLLIEYYAHASLPLGVLRVNVSIGRTSWITQIDGHCKSGCLPQQGFYFMHVAAERLEEAQMDSVSNRNSALVSLQVVPRMALAAAMGLEKASTFCVVSVIGERELAPPVETGSTDVIIGHGRRLAVAPLPLS